MEHIVRYIAHATDTMLSVMVHIVAFIALWYLGLPSDVLAISAVGLAGLASIRFRITEFSPLEVMIESVMIFLIVLVMQIWVAPKEPLQVTLPAQCICE